jgi:hypothetical protein
VTHATVREIVPDAEGQHIDHLEVRCLAGRHIVVRAQNVVLACGGIENARLLLASRSVMPNGLGNAHDLVGRFFMEHPHARGGRVIGPASWALLNAFRRRSVQRTKVAPLITPGEDLQAREGLLTGVQASVSVRTSA